MESPEYRAPALPINTLHPNEAESLLAFRVDTDPFQDKPINGAHAVFPPGYLVKTKSEVRYADCVIDLDGRAEDCHMAGIDSQDILATAALAWLNRDDIRYKPVSQNPVCERHLLRITFLVS